MSCTFPAGDHGYRTDGMVAMQIATICFADLDSGDEALVAVRVVGEAAGLALSLKRNGDIEVFLGKQELDQLIGALQKALAAMPGANPVA